MWHDVMPVFASCVCLALHKPLFDLLMICVMPRFLPRCRWYIDFGVKNIMKKAFADRVWAALRGTGRNTNAGSYLAGELPVLKSESSPFRPTSPGLPPAASEGRRMVLLFPDFEDPDNSGYELGIDWVEPYKSVGYAVWLFWAARRLIVIAEGLEMKAAAEMKWTISCKGIPGVKACVPKVANI